MSFLESFNGSLRDEYLSAHWSEDLADARVTLEAWRIDYNESRPHRALGDIPPGDFFDRWASRGIKVNPTAPPRSLTDHLSRAGDPE